MPAPKDSSQPPSKVRMDETKGTAYLKTFGPKAVHHSAPLPSTVSSSLNISKTPPPTTTAPKKTWRTRHGANQFAFADDRFTFPPVPGYTGYIPRSREHFGKSYQVTTTASLSDFEKLYATKEQLPEKVEKISHGTPVWVYPTVTKQGHVSAAMAKSKRAAELQSQCSITPFISGYTGFVPQMRNQFGAQYQKSAVIAMQASKANQKLNQHSLREFDTNASGVSSSSSSITATTSASHQLNPTLSDINSNTKLHPIPGYTGFIPLSRYSYAHTYGHSLKNLQSSKSGSETNMPKKDLSQTLPITGYKGFLPFYQMCGEKSFGQTSKKCIEEFKLLMKSQ